MILIRDMAEGDTERMIDIVRMCDPGIPESLRRDLARWHAAGKPDTERYFVAAGDDEVVGLVGFQPDAWGVRDISWLVWGYIDPVRQRQGIGDMLFDHAEQILVKRGIRKIYLDVGNADAHVAAINFHERRGYAREGHLPDFWRDGEDFIIFGKRFGQ